jgi:hypothetical protein
MSHGGGTCLSSGTISSSSPQGSSKSSVATASPKSSSLPSDSPSLSSASAGVPRGVVELSGLQLTPFSLLCSGQVSGGSSLNATTSPSSCIGGAQGELFVRTTRQSFEEREKGES